MQCNEHLTMSMTSLRRLCRCRLVRFWKMSQFSSCRSLKPTARWWFSSTDSSLYINANSESVKQSRPGYQWISWLTSEDCPLGPWPVWKSCFGQYWILKSIHLLIFYIHFYALQMYSAVVASWTQGVVLLLNSFLFYFNKKFKWNLRKYGNWFTSFIY